MDSRSQALQDLYKGMIVKVGDSANNRNLVSKEIEKLVKTKSKLSVKDLDDLEHKIISKASSPTMKRKISITALRNSDKKDYFLPEAKSNYRSTKVSPIKELDEKRPEYDLANQETPQKLMNVRENIRTCRNLDTYKNNTDVNSNSLTPSKIRLKKKYDEWGMIIRADSEKFHKEMEYLRRKEKLHKLEYSNELLKQAHEVKYQKVLERKGDFEEDLNMCKRVHQEHQNLQSTMKLQKDTMKQLEKQELDKIYGKKLTTHMEFRNTRKTEKDQSDQISFEYLQEEISKSMNKFKQRRKVAIANMSKSKLTKLQKMDDQLRTLQQELFHNETAAKVLNESEEKYRNIISTKASKAHDEKRLLKLIVVKPKTLNDYEKEASEQEKQILATMEETEKR